MNITSICIALAWGTVAGFLLPRIIGSLLALTFCLHGLLLTHWKRLANKAATGLIRPGTLADVIFWTCLSLVIFGTLLKLGDKISSGFGFDYHGAAALLFAAAACISGATQLRPLWRRLVTSWKMSHEYDYAERRKRTRMLRF